MSLFVSATTDTDYQQMYGRTVRKFTDITLSDKGRQKFPGLEEGGHIELIEWDCDDGLFFNVYKKNGDLSGCVVM